MYFFAFFFEDMDAHPQAAAAVGWISIAAWIVVSASIRLSLSFYLLFLRMGIDGFYSSFDQIYLNYVSQSGDGLSTVFLFIWLAGDSTNLIGSLLQGLLPTMSYLAAYYLACDLLLIGQG